MLLHMFRACFKQQLEFCHECITEFKAICKTDYLIIQMNEMCHRRKTPISPHKSTWCCSARCAMTGTSHRTAGGKEFVSIKHHIKQNHPHFIFSQPYSGPAPTNKSPPRGDGTTETQTSHAVSPFAFRAEPLTSCVLFPGKRMIVSQQPSKLCRRQKQASLLHLPHKQPL